MGPLFPRRAGLEPARELRNGEDGNAQFLRKRLQTIGDLGDFLRSVVAAVKGAVDQLQVVDDYEPDILFAAHSASLRSDLRHSQAAGLVDEEWPPLQALSGLEQAMHDAVRGVG